MMTPPEEDPNEPYPGVRGAIALTFMALMASFFTTVALFGVGALAAYGVGRAIGVGAVASMAAQRIGEPQAERLGLQRLDLQAIPLILCLIPAVLLASELDNFAYDWAGDEPGMAAPFQSERESTLGEAATSEERDRAEADGYDPLVPDVPFDPVESEATPAEVQAVPQLLDLNDPATRFQAFIVMVGIIPLVDCFLFFGVIQQGLIRRRGLLRGVVITGLFWMLLRDVPIVGMTRFFVGSAALLGMGTLLGLVRVATGSILGPMLLASAWAAIEFLALATHEQIPLPGLNVEGTHLPWLVSTASAVIVAWSARTVYQEAERRSQDPEGGPPQGPSAPNVHALRPRDPD